MWLFPVFFLIYDSKPKIFGFWTKQDIWGRYLGYLVRHFSPLSDILQIKQLIHSKNIIHRWNQKYLLAAAILDTTFITSEMLS